MDDVELPEPAAAKPYHSGIHCQIAVAVLGSEIGGLHAIQFAPPTLAVAECGSRRDFRRSEPQVGSQDRDLVPHLNQLSSDGADLDCRPASVLKRVVGLGDFKDAHRKSWWSRVTRSADLLFKVCGLSPNCQEEPRTSTTGLRYQGLMDAHGRAGFRSQEQKALATRRWTQEYLSQPFAKGAVGVIPPHPLAAGIPHLTASVRIGEQA